MKKSKIEYYVGMNVKYGRNDSFHDPEDRFTPIAKKYGGYCGGAGYGGDGRDLSFYFKTDVAATKFRNHVKKMKNVSKEFQYSLNYSNPNTGCDESMDIEL